MSTTEVFVCGHCGHSETPDFDRPLPKACPECGRETTWRRLLRGEHSRYDAIFLRNYFIASDRVEDEPEE